MADDKIPRATLPPNEVLPMDIPVGPKDSPTSPMRDPALAATSNLSRAYTDPYAKAVHDMPIKDLLNPAKVRAAGAARPVRGWPRKVARAP